MKKNKSQKLTHQISPFILPDSKILILGTFPSPKSRETGFYYGHPQNRFWKVLAYLLEQEVPKSVAEKKEFLEKNHIGLWDVLDSCEITGASDSSIKNPVVNNIAKAISHTEIKQIFVTGQKAWQLYKRYCQKETGRSAILLPSSSPANCAMSFETLVEKYRVILEYLNGKQ